MTNALATAVVAGVFATLQLWLVLKMRQVHGLVNSQHDEIVGIVGAQVDQLAAAAVRHPNDAALRPISTLAPPEPPEAA